MQRVFKGGALVALIAILIAPAVYADDPPDPFDPPEARISPPGGVAAEARISPPGGVATQVRIRPPSGSEGRLGPPIGGRARIGAPTGIAEPEPPTVFDLFWAWLQVRIRPPIR